LLKKKKKIASTRRYALSSVNPTHSVPEHAEDPAFIADTYTDVYDTYCMYGGTWRLPVTIVYEQTLMARSTQALTPP
jgi:hypothetical protein